jgi:hypothetical protein
MYQAEALVSLLVAILDLDGLSQSFVPMCTRTLHVVDDPYPPVYVGCGQFRTDILAYLGFKRIYTFLLILQ